MLESSVIISLNFFGSVWSRHFQ